MDLSEFLLARIGEDEQRARDFEQQVAGGINAEGSTSVWYQTAWKGAEMLGVSPARVLAECEAKRRIVAEEVRNDDLTWPGGAAGADAEQVRVWRLLALPYADHPDYDEAWRV